MNRVKRTLLSVTLGLSIFASVPSPVYADDSDTDVDWGSLWFDSYTEEETSSENENDTPSPETKSEETEKQNNETKITAESSYRLIVTGTEINDEHIISNYENTYLLQYETFEDAQTALETFRDSGISAEFDTVLYLDEGEETPEETVLSETEMTEDSNPLNELENAVNNMPGTSHDIAVIDSGTNHSGIETISMVGDDGQDHIGHGDSMINYIRDEYPEANILAIKVISDEGTADASTVYSAIKYATERNVKVINISMSAYANENNQAINEAINEANSKGIVVIVSAGNNGTNAKYFTPANAEKAFAVGASDANGYYQSFSNYGYTVKYLVSANSTSEAAARMTGLVTKYLNNSYGGNTNIFLDENSRTSLLSSIRDDTHRATFPKSDPERDADFEMYLQSVRSSNGYALTPDALSVDTSGHGNVNGYSYAFDKNFYPSLSNATITGLSNLSYNASGSGDNAAELIVNGSGGGVTLTWNNCIFDGDGKRYGFRMTISNVSYSGGGTGRYGVLSENIWQGSRVMSFNCHNFSSMQFNVNLQVLTSSGSPVSSGSIAYGFTDLDSVESITFNGGVSKIWVDSNRVISVSGNTVTGSDAADDLWRQGFMTVGAGSGTSYVWRGESCGTPFWPAWSILNPTEYTITSGVTGGTGTISPTPKVTVVSGQNSTFTMTPGTNQRIKSVTVDGAAQSSYVGKTTAQTYTFSNVRANHSIYVAYEPNQFRQRVYVRYQDKNGNWGSYTTNSPGYDGMVSYNSTFSWTGPNETNVYKAASPKTFNYKVTAAKDNYSDIARKQYTYSFESNKPTRCPDWAWATLANMQTAFTKYAENTPGTAKSPTLTGYTFKGWNEKANGTGAWYNANESMLSNKTFYAIWEPIVYKITYDLNDTSSAFDPTKEKYNKATNHADNPATFTIETPTITIKNPTRPSYDFLGWTGSNGDTEQFNPQIVYGEPTSIGDKHYVAHWKITNRTLTITNEVNLIRPSDPDVPIFIYDVRGTDLDGNAQEYTVVLIHTNKSLTAQNSITVPAGEYTAIQQVNNKYTVKANPLSADLKDADGQIDFYNYLRVVGDLSGRDLVINHIGG